MCAVKHGYFVHFFFEWVKVLLSPSFYYQFRVKLLPCRSLEYVTSTKMNPTFLCTQIYNLWLSQKWQTDCKTHLPFKYRLLLLLCLDMMKYTSKLDSLTLAGMVIILFKGSHIKKVKAVSSANFRLKFLVHASQKMYPLYLWCVINIHTHTYSKNESTDEQVQESIHC